MDSSLSLETKIALLDQRVSDLLERLDEIKAMELRISALERWRAWVLGAGAFMGAALGWLGHLILTAVSK